MFVLKNKSGNAITRTKSERKRDQLLALGYVELTQERVEMEGDYPSVTCGDTSPDKGRQEEVGVTAKGDTEGEPDRVDEETPSVTADAATPPSVREAEDEGDPEQTTPTVEDDSENTAEDDAEAEVNPEPERKGRTGRNTQAAKKADKE